MKPEMKEKMEAAARELWDENPDLRGKYGNNFQVFLQTHKLLMEWRTNPQLQQEFGGDFKLYATYKRHEVAGDISVSTGKTIS